MHSIQQLYEDMYKSVQGILLVDAKNAFNTINRETRLHNIQHVCPALTITLQNCYHSPSRFFRQQNFIENGTTQGDPLSTPFYDLALLPLLSYLEKEHPTVRPAWLADGLAGAARLQELRK